MAHTTTYTCDRCGTEIERQQVRGYTGTYAVRTEVRMDSQPLYEDKLHADLCLPCGKVVRRALEEALAAGQGEKALRAEPEKARTKATQAVVAKADADVIRAQVGRPSGRTTE